VMVLTDTLADNNSIGAGASSEDRHKSVTTRLLGLFALSVSLPFSVPGANIASGATNGG
jgi:hypothetical protein